jgi:quinol monooxygenase YgiN
MIYVIAKLMVNSGKQEAFKAVLRDLAAEVKRCEPGTLVYQLTASRQDDTIFKMIELYKDQEAQSVHGQSQGFKDIAANLAGILAGPPETEKLDIVG